MEHRTSRFEQLVTLVRALVNEPDGPYTFVGPTSNGSGDIKAVTSEINQHTDLYFTRIVIGNYSLCCEIRKPYERKTHDISKGPAAPSPDECVEALIVEARKCAVRARDEKLAHAELLGRALSHTW